MKNVQNCNAVIKNRQWPTPRILRPNFHFLTIFKKINFLIKIVTLTFFRCQNDEKLILGVFDLFNENFGIDSFSKHPYSVL